MLCNRHYMRDKDSTYIIMYCSCCGHEYEYINEKNDSYEYDEKEGWNFCPYCGTPFYSEKER